MSHFSVLVIGNDVEKQLAPYQENNMGDCPKEYLEFVDVEEEYVDEYETGTKEMVELEDGTRVSTWDDRFRVPNPEYGINGYKMVVPEHLKRVEVPLKELYSDISTFVKEYHGFERDDETGKFGYWENPNKQWDWWVVGGRYSGRLKVKAGASGTQGSRSWTNENEAIEEQFCDQARWGDLDWDGMKAQRYANLEKAWADAQDKNETAKRFLYGIEPGMTKEQYLAKAEDFSVFAVVKDGKWYERGEMGWWGVVSDEKDANDWKTEMKELLSGISDDTLITIVDCHI
ncbi:hypothetical protein [Myxococcus phage Mx1]|nr:hypothetical protein [Myxococcus phage Mx1]